MSRRTRPPITTAAPVQAGPPQDMPLAGEFPPSPMGMQQAPVGQTPPPAGGMANLKKSKSKGKRGKPGK